MLLAFWRDGQALVDDPQWWILESDWTFLLIRALRLESIVRCARNDGKYAFNIACQAYGKETKSGLFFTLNNSPKRLVSFNCPREFLAVLSRQ